MKQAVKAILAGLLAVLLTACQAPNNTSAAEKEVPTVQLLVIGGSKDEACKRISEQVSAITLEKLGCRVEIQCAALTDYELKLTRMRVDDELPDIFVSQSKDKLSEFAASGEILCLDDVLEQEDALYQEVKNDIEWRNVTLENHIYGIPFGNNQPYCAGFVMRKDICDALGIDAEQITDMEALHQVLLQVHQAYPDMMTVAPNYSNVTPVVNWDSMNNAVGMSAVGVLPYQEPMENQLQLITQIEAFRDWCQTMYQWNREGLIPENSSLNQEPRQALMKSGMAFGGFVRYNQSSAINAEISGGQEVYYALLSAPRLDYADNGSAFCISKNCVDPQLSLAVLRLLYTDDTLLQLCTLGQEGTDYHLVDGKPVSGEETTDQYITTLWCWPNNRRLIASLGIEEKELPGSVCVSPASGFLLDSQICMEEYNACHILLKQLYPALINGEIDPEQGIPYLDEALRKAGAETLLQEEQRQLDNYRRENGIQNRTQN